ncbi:MAG TPA: type II secretion system protein [Epsilonproteobacteria bacterium]|nr:type II secretion system protein [Campylobacterota bacterium]
MQWQRQRKAFSMLTAIFVIVLMATVAMLILSTSGKMIQETTAQYQREQSLLLAQSYTEYAIMAVTANDRNSTNLGDDCLDNISGNYGGTEGYTIDVNISYIGRDIDKCGRKLSTTVTTPKSPLNIIVDVFVHYKEFDHPAGTSAPNITYHKRSLQKI